MALLRRVWFQIHWFIGITVGSVLVVIGLSGATLSFRAEITDLLNPTPAASAAPALAPPALVARVQAEMPGRRIATVAVSTEPGRAARIGFAPPPGERRGETRFADPATGALLPDPVGEHFFEFVEELHRWLLLPRDDGKPITGSLAGLLLLLALSGLYLRWPRRPFAWRQWLRIDFALRGRAFLWNLHAVVGTIALLAYVVSTSTGMYWAFDGLRKAIDGAVGEGRVVRAERAPADAPVTLDLVRVWQAFVDTTGGDWTQVTLRLPARNGTQVEAVYLRTHAEHERARNRLYLQAATGETLRHERYADKPPMGRFVNSIYPLHMGTYWGLPGRIVMMLTSLGLALFAISGWMMYLGRRRTAKAVRAERARLDAAAVPAASGDAGQVLVAFASQTGHAERLALQTAGALQAAGVAAVVRPVSALSADALLHFRQVLWVASSFGEGDPPDSARAFARAFARQSGPGLRHLRYGLLALGDRNYATFCGFGRKLDHDLHNQGAQPLFPMIEVDGEDPVALARWHDALRETFGVRDAAWPASDAAPAPAFDAWRLDGRRLLNAGSLGDPLFEIELRRVSGSDAASWVPGALVEIVPRQMHDDGAPAPAPRSYSVASIPSDGAIQLLVRQARHDNGLGVASGWLTVGAPVGAELALRLVANPGFALPDDARPCIFIGNGSGFAGLRALLRERARRGHGRNWLVFGERHAAHDGFGADEVAAWQAGGLVARADFVYSRDQAQRVYVQDRLREAAEALKQWVDEEDAIVFVCGSLEGMAPGVDAALTEVLGESGMDALIAEGRYRRDVY